MPCPFVNTTVVGYPVGAKPSTAVQWMNSFCWVGMPKAQTGNRWYPCDCHATIAAVDVPYLNTAIVPHRSQSRTWLLVVFLPQPSAWRTNNSQQWGTFQLSFSLISLSLENEVTLSSAIRSPYPVLELSQEEEPSCIGSRSSRSCPKVHRGPPHVAWSFNSP